eukprot:CAMPEP_0181211238 /NCGR_PEP_ID=MMETSP1096-20121128/23674_1 /TAXON_ID=156174 ORGANISM="Chrysochromulina ericina, Strain CCMP281" /NCGR_SAMPLE_ID=MMETSP1096 /ASSEMBLY_ACC=CAM_ASM_000453 /LENGTH=60 /DNA_ID=CAMNT_0023302615 /DNA_START=346 /DNA_END=525 /DNA_ORIENTATION=+
MKRSTYLARHGAHPLVAPMCAASRLRVCGGRGGSGGGEGRRGGGRNRNGRTGGNSGGSGG